jgi:uncharacterized protein (DUF3820 family)
MPFGKYKGVPVENLPDDYLCWLVQAVQLRGALRIAVFQQLGLDINFYEHLEAKIAQLEVTNQQLRDEVGRMTRSDSTQSAHDSLSAAALDKIYRHFALKYHPDRGGDGMFMQVINEVFDQLRRGLAP